MTGTEPVMAAFQGSSGIVIVMLETYLKTYNSVTALGTLLVDRFKIKIITGLITKKIKLMLFHQLNQQQLLKQLKLPRLFQPQLQHEKLKKELNHQPISKIKIISHPGKTHSCNVSSFSVLIYTV